MGIGYGLVINLVRVKGKLDLKNHIAETVTLWIDSYSDIFSDFDPRPFSDRMISDDFLAQFQRASREIKGDIAILRLLVPEGTQKEEHERVIKKRLHSFFLTMFRQIAEEIKEVRTRGVYFIIASMVLMLITSYISYLELSGFHINVLLVLFEPGSWFLFWTGLESLTSTSRARKKEIGFYSKLSNIHIEFSSYKL
ncbi:MAG TPA: hypothetical protein VGD40_26355 [Chryseosolibacter sp.]